jgi:hypothetical protein
MLKRVLLGSAFAMFLAVGAAQAQVVVRIGPPPPPRVVIPVSPGPRYVWTDGYYRWNRQDYVWVPGRYVIPPRHRAVWVSGHWAPRRRGYVWVPGHWR